MKELREKAEKHTFQAEVDRMMKLIINSLYRNKEVSSQSRWGADMVGRLAHRPAMMACEGAKCIVEI